MKRIRRFLPITDEMLADAKTQEYINKRLSLFVAEAEREAGLPDRVDQQCPSCGHTWTTKLRSRGDDE